MRAPKQSVWHPYEDTKMSEVPSFGDPGRRIFVVVALYMFKLLFTSQNLAWQTPKKAYEKKI